MDFATLTLPLDIPDAAANDDITTWQKATSGGTLALASGVVTLKANRVYDLSLCMSLTAYSDTTAGFGIYDIVGASSNTILVAKTRSALWPTTHAGGGGGPRGYSGVARFIYEVGVSDEDIKVRCTLGTGTHQVQSDNSHFTVCDIT